MTALFRWRARRSIRGATHTPVTETPPCRRTKREGSEQIGSARGDYDLYLENEAAGFSLLWIGWLNQPELPKLVRVTVPATGVCKNVTLDMGPRGASLDIVAIDASTRESLSKLIVTVNNSEHSRQGGSAYLVEPREVLVPSHAKFTVQVQADGYRASEPVRIQPLIPGEKKELTIPLRRQLMAEDNTR